MLPNIPDLPAFLTIANLIKFALLTLILLYAVFAFMLLNQVRSMTKTVILAGSFMPTFLKILSLLHVLASAFVFLLGLAIL